MQGEAGLQNPERRRTVHLRAGHVVTDHHFANWKVKGRKFSNLPTRDMWNGEMIWAVGSRRNLDHWFKKDTWWNCNNIRTVDCIGHMAKDHNFADWKVKGAKCSFDWWVVISRGHIVESWRADLEKPGSISEFVTWRVKRTHHRIPEMWKCEMCFWISLWSQPMVTFVEYGGRS